MKTLTINLTAPLQSYGNQATFERRTTGVYPTKSAVIGMLAAALGYERRDQRIVALNELQYAVRIDQVGKQLVDYQTVKMMDGKSKITYRNYLQDARFVVALGSEDDDLMDRLGKALRHPKFQLYLGRRANVPAGILKMTTSIAMTPVTVLEQFPWQAAPWYQATYHRRNRHVEDATLELIADANLLANQQSSLVKDRVVSFDQRDRQYGFRAVASEMVHVAFTIFSEDSPLLERADSQQDYFGVVGKK